MEKIAIIGGSGFIGTNLAISLASNNDVTVIDRNKNYFSPLQASGVSLKYKVGDFSEIANFDEQVEGQDIVYHLASTVIPASSNKDISNELESNISVTAKLLDACVRQKVKKVVFVSSGGAVYGKDVQCPISEIASTYPITSYGIEKLTIEKLLYLYNYQKGLDYRIVRLSNPYGPYQRPNGKLGVVTTFVYKALKNMPLKVYGDGSVIRDFIYIDDVVKAMDNITNVKSRYKLYNVGSGEGTSIKELIHLIENTLNLKLNVQYINGRNNDVPINYLNIDRYEDTYGNLSTVSLTDGIIKTANFMREKGML